MSIIETILWWIVAITAAAVFSTNDCVFVREIGNGGLPVGPSSFLKRLSKRRRERMANQRERKRKRAGSERRDQKHRAGGDWTTIAIPEGVKLYKPKEGTQRIDIVPYEVGEGNEYADPGEWYYERTYFRHAGIGPENGMYLCLAKNFHKPCPICEHRGLLASDPNVDKETEKYIKDLAPKERQLWLVLDHAAMDDGVQLWEVSHFCFGALFEEGRRDAEEDEDYIRNFDDEEAGATLKVRFKDEAGPGFKFLKASAVEFKPRPKGLDSKWIKHGVCLDSLLKEMDYDELKAIFLQTGGPAEESSTEESKEDDSPTADSCGISRLDEVVYAGEICTVSRISKDGTSLTLIDSNDELIKAVAPNEVTKAEDAKEEIPKQAPVEQVAAAVDSGVKDDDDDFDEDWDDD